VDRPIAVVSQYAPVCLPESLLHPGLVVPPAVNDLSHLAHLVKLPIVQVTRHWAVPGYHHPHLAAIERALTASAGEYGTHLPMAMLGGALSVAAV